MPTRARLAPRRRPRAPGSSERVESGEPAAGGTASSCLGRPLWCRRVPERGTRETASPSRDRCRPSSAGAPGTVRSGGIHGALSSCRYIVRFAVGRVLAASPGRLMMTSGEVLRHSVSIDEQEVFCLIHKPVELLELQPSNFAGRVASWAEHAERRYGDSINPVMTYVESGPHRVSWIYHEGEDSRSGERFCTYHIICDCIAGVEGNSPQESVDSHPGLWSRPPRSPEEGGLRRPQVSNVRDPGCPERPRYRRLRAVQRLSHSSPSRPSAASSSSTHGIRRNGRAT